MKINPSLFDVGHVDLVLSPDERAVLAAGLREAATSLSQTLDELFVDPRSVNLKYLRYMEAFDEAAKLLESGPMVETPPVPPKEAE